MSLFTKADLTPPLYPEIIDEIIRNYISVYATLSAFPVTGIVGRTYKATDTDKLYIWTLTAYAETTGPDAIVTKSINNGISEAKSYLNRYDLVKMFDDDDAKRTFKDEFLNTVVKDIICWQLIKLANPNINLELFRTSYKDAIDTLIKVMKGLIDPQWPLRVDDPNTPNDDAGNVEFRSEIKRQNHF